MQQLLSFYTNNIEKYKTELARVAQQMFASSMLRLAVFVLAAIGVYFFIDNTRIVLAIVFFTLLLFLFLVARHTDLQYKRDKLKALLELNETEIQVLNRKFHHLPDGSTYKDPLHFYSQDIDLFGRGSFYQYANRTALAQGSDVFAGLLTENSIDAIPQKQKAIKELANMAEWRQDFSAVASLTKT
ncbi:MAG: DNA mismatch repair protein MutS, partial [Flavobacteriaceae bacterium]